MKRRPKTEVKALVKKIQEERKTGASLSSLLTKYDVGAPTFYRYTKTTKTKTADTTLPAGFTDIEIVCIVKSNLDKNTKTKVLSSLF